MSSNFDYAKYTAACMNALERQMPNLWAKYNDLVLEAWQQTGGFCMVLQSDVDPYTDTYRMMIEDGNGFLVHQFSASEHDDEGTEVIDTPDIDLAVAAFLADSHAEVSAYLVGRGE